MLKEYKSMTQEEMYTLVHEIYKVVWKTPEKNIRMQLT